jgi:hypothetical protein
MSKGGGSAPSEQTVIQSNLPEYAEPFYRDLLARVGYESAVPYETYPAQRLEYFTPSEQEAMRRFQQLGVSGTPEELMAAGDIAAQVGQGSPYAQAMLAATAGAQGPSTYEAGQSGFTYLPGARSITAGLPSQYTAQGRLSTYSAGDFDPGYLAQQRASGFDAERLGLGYQAGAFDPGYQAGDIQQGYTARDLQAGYKAGEFDPGYVARELGQDYTARDLQSQYEGALDVGPGFEAGTIADPRTIESYMSPYQQLVVDREKEEARRQSRIMEQQLGLQAAGAGSLGGYREAIMQAERQRSLEDQLGDIQAAGSQQAFEQAQRAFEADRAARLQAGQFGLQRGQAQQQALQEAERFRQAAFGTTEQARQAQQQMAISSFEAGERARQQAAQFGMTAQQQADAARQAQEQFEQQAFQQTEAGRRAQQEMDVQAFQAGESARQQAAQMGLTAQQQEDAARQAQEQFRQSGFQQEFQQRQFQEQSEQQAFQFGEQARQRAAEMGLSAQQQEDAARQAQEQFRQRTFEQNEAMRQAQMQLGLERFGAGIGAMQSAEQLRLQQFQANEAARQAQEQAALARARTSAELAQSGYGQLLSGEQQRLAAAGMMGDFVAQRQAQEMERLRAMQTAGQIERELLQRGLDLGYTDFLRQQAYPKEQLAFYSSMLQGLPIAPGQISQSYGITPSTTQQLLGAGIAGVGLYNALGGFGG